MLYFQNVNVLVNEGLLLIFYSAFLSYELKFAQVTSEGLAIFGIQIVFIALSFNGLTIMLIALKELLSKLISRCRNISSKIQPTMNTTKTEKFESKL